MSELEKLVTILGSDAQVLHDTCVKYTWDANGRDFWQTVLTNDIAHIVKTILAIQRFRKEV